MTIPMNRAATPSMLEEGLNKVLGTSYNYVHGEHKELFDIETSDKAFEEEVMSAGLGTAAVKAEGAGIEYDTMQETFKSRYTHETVALGFAITMEQREDNLYLNYANMASKELGKALAETKEAKAAAVFNNGFDSNFAGGDGVALFSAAHPTLAGDRSNTVSADLSETALENALIEIQDFRDERGLLMNVTAECLHIPTALQFTAAKILESTHSTVVTTQGTDGVTNVNDINAINRGGFFPRGVKVNRRFTDEDAWFIKTSATNGTKMFQRSKLKAGMQQDFNTGNWLYKAHERYCFGWSDWRQWYGSNGA